MYKDFSYCIETAGGMTTIALSNTSSVSATPVQTVTPTNTDLVTAMVGK